MKKMQETGRNSKETEQNTPLKVAIIGYQHAQTHLAALQEFGEGQNTNVAALVGRTEEKVKKVAKEFGVETTYQDYQKMLEKERPDIVIITTPHSLHKEMAIAALEAGAHVLVEKPMATNAKEVEEMFETARKNDRALVAAMSTRCYPEIQHLKRSLERFKIGKINRIVATYFRRLHVPTSEGFTSRERAGGGVILDLGTHMLDLALWLDFYPRGKPEILAQTWQNLDTRDMQNIWGAPPQIYDVEDLASITIKLAGVKYDIDVGWITPLKEAEIIGKPDETAPSLKIIGQKGGYTWRPGNLEFHGYSKRSGEAKDEKIPIEDKRSRYAAQLAQFFEAVRNGTASELTPKREMVMLHKIIDEAYRQSA